MAQTAITKAHAEVIDRINAVTTTAGLAAILAGITHLDRPGFPHNLPDGAYTDGAFIATVTGGFLATTQITHLAPHVLTLWGEIDAQQRDAHTTAADATRAARDARRGRPEIGRPVPIRMPEWMVQLIDSYADQHDMSRPAAARSLIAAGHRAVTAHREGTI